MPDPDDIQPAADAADAVPTRPRRAASRPAGPPEPLPEPPVSPAPEAASEPAKKPATRSRRARTAEPDGSVDTPVDAEPAKPTRRRTTAAKAATSDVVPEAGEDAPKPRTRRTAKPAADLPVDAEAPAPRRRTRATKTAPPDDVADTHEPEHLAQEAAPAAEPLPITLPHSSGGAARSRGTRRTAPVEAFGMVAESTEAALDSLAAAIGGTAAPAEGDEDLGAGDAADSDPRRRRRRRGGRRRRRSGDTASLAGDDEPGVEGEEDDELDDTEVLDEAAPDGTVRRRRRRRRRGEEIGGADDDPSDVVVRVREPRRAKSASDEVTGIEGSTRMEAKKQRRREGRAAGRRRAPILSESEFLARRESVERSMLIRQAEDYSQIAVMEDGILVEHYVDRSSSASMIGNIYLGRVQNVLPSMEAAFIDIGRGRNAVLYAGEVDWDSFGVTGTDKKVEQVFTSGQTVLVQVSKDPVGAKGARLTSHISIPGRYIVYSPGGHLSGISRKLPEGERKRLKAILDELVEPTASVIVRTAAEGTSEEELVRDVNRLKAQWEVIAKKVSGGQAPQMLYGEPDLTVRIVRDLFTEDFTSLVVDGNGQPNDAFDTVEAYVAHVAPHLSERVSRWDRAGNGDLFDRYRIQEQIAKALERKVFLPSGGSLIIDRTEAMTVIDVNTGKFTGTQGNLEATVTANNLEAAEEIVRQLRLRDIGGIIVIDFIDMVLPSNRELLLRRLVECLGRDRTRHQVAEVTSLGLVQMTRKKIGTGLSEAFTVGCETCNGRGYHTHDVPVASQAPADGGDRDHNRHRGGRSNTRTRRKTD